MEKCNSNLVDEFISSDGVIRKLVIKSIVDNIFYETSSFLIEDRGRVDICLSCMAGCPLGCRICATTYSKSRFDRKLTCNEIVDQLKLALLRPDIPDDFDIRIGFMGNGEPFLNLQEIRCAIKQILNQHNNKLTEIAVSTIGVNIEATKQLLTLSGEAERKIKLQLSLYSLNTKKRESVIPAAPDIYTITKELDDYAKAIEMPVRYNYPLIKGFNDSDEDLSALIEFFKPFPETRRLKLSAFNMFDGLELFPATDERIVNTYNFLKDNGLVVDLFFGNRDSSILASCGQMRSRIQQETQ